MRACIIYIWKIFDEILKEIVELETNVLKNQSLFSPDGRCFASNKLPIDPIDSLILHRENITNYVLKKLSLIFNTLSVKNQLSFDSLYPIFVKTHSLTKLIVAQSFSLTITSKTNNEYYSYNTIVLPAALSIDAFENITPRQFLCNG